MIFGLWLVNGHLLWDFLAERIHTSAASLLRHLLHLLLHCLKTYLSGEHDSCLQERIVANLFESSLPRRGCPNNGKDKKKENYGEKPNRTHPWIAQDSYQLVTRLRHAISFNSLSRLTDEKLKQLEVWMKTTGDIFGEIWPEAKLKLGEIIPSSCCFGSFDLALTFFSSRNGNFSCHDGNLHIMLYNLLWFTIIYDLLPCGKLCSQFVGHRIYLRVGCPF